MGLAHGFSFHLTEQPNFVPQSLHSPFGLIITCAWWAVVLNLRPREIFDLGKWLQLMTALSTGKLLFL